LLAATAPSKICLIPERVFGVEGVGMDVIQAPKWSLESWYELIDDAWGVIRPMLPNKPRVRPGGDSLRFRSWDGRGFQEALIL
jgi:hypothetical protein